MTIATFDLGASVTYANSTERGARGTQITSDTLRARETPLGLVFIYGGVVIALVAIYAVYRRNFTLRN